MTLKVGEMYAMGWIARESSDGARSVTTNDGTSCWAFHPQMGLRASTAEGDIVPPGVVEWLVQALASGKEGTL